MLLEELTLNAWTILEQTKIPEKNFVNSLRIEAKESDKNDVYLLISSDHKYHLFIRSNLESISELVKPNVRGLNINYVLNFQVGENNFSNFINISCEQKSYLTVFTQIIKEICELTLIQKTEPKEAVNTIILRWKSFWSKPKSEKYLSDEMLIGLIGELYFLNQCLDMSFQSIKSWVGPKGYEKDFQFKKVFFEVKASFNSYHIHKINGLRQLEVYPDTSLYLVSILFKSNVDLDSGITLIYLINQIEKKINGQPFLLDEFYDLLYQSGYFPEHNSYYEERKFQLTDYKIYFVDKQFPRLLNSSFKDGLSERITNIIYSVDCTGLDSLSFSVVNQYIK